VEDIIAKAIYVNTKRDAYGIRSKVSGRRGRKRRCNVVRATVDN
jgi:hypothetical protein